MKPLVLVAALALLAGSGCSKNQGNQAGGSTPQEKASGSETVQGGAGMQTEESHGLSYRVPEDWTATQPNSAMRAAQYAIPAASGEASPELVLYYFGEGQGGGTQANIDRWIGQMKQPNGQPVTDQAETRTLTVHGLKVTTVAVNGTYSGGMMPGMGSAQEEAGYRLWGAVVEGPGGPWFFKAVGPEDVMKAAEPGFEALVASLEPGKGEAAGQ